MYIRQQFSLTQLKKIYFKKNMEQPTNYKHKILLNNTSLIQPTQTEPLLNQNQKELNVLNVIEKGCL